MDQYVIKGGSPAQSVTVAIGGAKNAGTGDSSSSAVT